MSDKNYHPLTIERIILQMYKFSDSVILDILEFKEKNKLKEMEHVLV